MLWGNLATTAIDEVVAICIPKLLLSTGGGWMDGCCGVNAVTQSKNARVDCWVNANGARLFKKHRHQLTYVRTFFVFLCTA